MKLLQVLSAVVVTMVMASASHAVNLLETDFTGIMRTAGSPTGTNITWISNGINDAGDLTAMPELPQDNATFNGLFTTAASNGHFAVDRNTGNEGPWSVDIPLVLTGGKVILEEVFIDWQDFDNNGNLQGAARDKIYTATVTDSLNTVLGSVAVLTASATSGTDTLVFAMPIMLTNNDTYTLNLRAEHGNNAAGNNTGFDALQIRGQVIIPEPATATLGLVGVAGMLVRRRRAV